MVGTWKKSMTPNHDLLLERYPDLAFALAHTPIQVVELEACVTQYDLDAVDVVYLIGIDPLSAQTLFTSWLQKKKTRVLFLLDDRLEAFRTLLHTPFAEQLLSNSQVRWVWVRDEWEKVLDECVQAVPSLSIEVLGSLKKKFRLKLMRKVAVTDAQDKEILYAHRLLDNVWTNITRWPISFPANALRGQFANIPAIICGAGPSLNKSIEYLSELEDRALIMAGGSAIAALSNQGIVPHLGLVLDPNPEEYDRLRLTSAFEMPMIYGTRVQKDVFNASNGPLGYLRSCTGGSCEAFFEKKAGIEMDPIGPDMGEEAFSVTTLAIAFAVAMGCNPIVLTGVDLAYTGMERYAFGVMPSSRVQAKALKQEKRAPDRLLRRKNCLGKWVYTQVRWVMESKVISAYAKQHSHIQWINVSKEALGFEGMSNRSFEEVVSQYLTRSFDLRAMVHQQIALSGKLQVALDPHQTEVMASLERLMEMAKQFLEELSRVQREDTPFPTGKMVVLQLDVEEEPAFDCFFGHIGCALDRYAARCHPLEVGLTPSEQRQLTLSRHAAKWNYILKQCLEINIAINR